MNLSQDWGWFRVICQNTNSHSFQDLLRPTSNCRLDVESSLRHLLHYPACNTEIHILLSTLKIIDSKPLPQSKQMLTKTLFFSSSSFDINTNINILNATGNLVKDLLKALTKGLFNAFTYCYRDKGFNKKLNKSVSIWLVTQLSFWIYCFSLFFLCS